MVLGHQNQMAKCPDDTQCSQMVLNSRQILEPIVKNSQIAFHVHKLSSVADRPQNQLAKSAQIAPHVPPNSQHQRHTGTTAKNAQIALVLKNSSQQHRHQDQLARMPKQHYSTSTY